MECGNELLNYRVKFQEKVALLVSAVMDLLQNTLIKLSGFNSFMTEAVII